MAALLLAVLTPARAAAPKENLVDFDGQNLAVWEKRPERPKAVIVLLHGRTWSSLPDFDLQVPGEHRSLMDAFVARGYIVYALDLPGYGKSPRLPSGWLSPDEAVEALATTLRWVGEHSCLPGKPALLGWSNGSCVSHLLAQRHPELISNLILFGFPADVMNRPIGPAMPDKPARAPTTRKGALSDFITPGSISDEAKEAYVAAALASDPVRSDWRHLEQWRQIDPAGIKVPVLLLQGEFDPIAVTEQQARAFVRFGNPDRQWTILAGGDHAALIENTQPAFVAAVANFLERPRSK